MLRRLPSLGRDGRAAAARADRRQTGARAQRPDPEAADRQRQARYATGNRRIEIAGWIWRETEPANYLIETYLGGRLILDPIPATIRLHRSLRHKEAGCRRPAMVGAGRACRARRAGRHALHLSGAGRLRQGRRVEPRQALHRPGRRRRRPPRAGGRDARRLRGDRDRASATWSTPARRHGRRCRRPASAR